MSEVWVSFFHSTLPSAHAVKVSVPLAYSSVQLQCIDAVIVSDLLTESAEE